MFPFAKAPALQVETVRGAQAARSEICMVYDRWSRTDSGGFLKAIKSALGVLEDIDIVENFETAVNSKHTLLYFDSNIRDRCMTQLNKRLSEYISEARKALESLESTISHTDMLRSKYESNRVDECIIQYLSGMSESMKNLIDFRLHACEKIERVKSFANEFEEIQFLLLILSETSADYIPRKAAEKIVRSFPLTPRELDSVRAGNGADLFTQ